MPWLVISAGIYARWKDEQLLALLLRVIESAEAGISDKGKSYLTAWYREHGQNWMEHVYFSPNTRGGLTVYTEPESSLAHMTYRGTESA